MVSLYLLKKMRQDPEVRRWQPKSEIQNLRYDRAAAIDSDKIKAIAMEWLCKYALISI